MKEKRLIHPQIGEILLVKGGSKRNIRLSVHPVRGIRVSMPILVSFREAEKFIDSKIAWILKAQQKMEQKRELSKIDISGETAITIIGGTIRFIKEGDKDKLTVRSSDGSLFTIHYGDNHSRELVLSGLNMLIRRQARLYLPGRLSELAARHGFRYNKLFLKNNRSNWGSCSSKSNINLNIHLMRLSPELCDHIILHELCHLKHRNHGSEFHKLLDNLCNGEEKRLSSELRRYKPYLE